MTGIDKIIRFYGDTNSIAILMIKSFGSFQLYNPDEALDNYDVLVIESNNGSSIIDATLCKKLFKKGKAIGFLGVTEGELMMLSECIGRKYSIVGKNIFICPVKHNNEYDSEFAITIIPNYTEEELRREYESEDKKIFREISNKFKIHPLKSSKHYRPPPGGLPRILFPVGDYTNVSGSWSVPFSKNLSYKLRGYPGLGPGTINIDLTMQVNLKVLANVFLAPKEYGGDGNYHVLFHVEMTSVFPTSWYEVSFDNRGIIAKFYYVFSYACGISPQLSPNDRKYSAERTVPDKESVSKSSTFGYNIYTKFGLGTNFPVTIPIEVVRSNGPRQSFSFNPEFASMINQTIFPNLINYTPEAKNTDTMSKVLFKASSDDGGNLKTNGKFEMISYFNIERKENETTAPVTFLLDLNFLGAEVHNNTDLNHAFKNSFVLDLAKMSVNLPKYIPPSN